MIKSYEKELIKELKKKGFNYKNSEDIYKVKLYPPVPEIILKWLPLVYSQHLGTGDILVRSLISSVEPFQSKALVDLFENSDYNEVVKWSIGYVLSISKTEDISNWILDQLINKGSSFSRSSFLYAIKNKLEFKSKIEITELLKSIFDKYFYYENYRKMYKKYAEVGDIKFLLQKKVTTNLEDYKILLQYSDSFFGDNKAKNAEKRFQKEVDNLIKALKKKWNLLD